MEVVAEAGMMMTAGEVEAVPLTAHHLLVVAQVLEEACLLAGPLLPVIKLLKNVAILNVHLPRAFLLLLVVLIHVVHVTVLTRTDKLMSESKCGALHYLFSERFARKLFDGVCSPEV